MAEQGHEVLDGDKQESWLNARWRPMMGWMYMLVCTMDFVIFPIFWSLLQAMNHGRVETQWNPITLQGAGLFHMAMGAIIGVAAFGRTQEKLAGANNGGANTSPSTSSPTPASSFGIPATQAPVSSGFASSPAVSTPVTGGFGGGLNSSTPATPTANKFGTVVPQQEDPVL